MLTVLSPAKSLDYDTPLPLLSPTQPLFQARAVELAMQARSLSPDDLRQLMDISEPLAVLNAGRFQAFQAQPAADITRPALFAFNGDVYTGFDAHSLAPAALPEAQARIRILSGLYGMLRPLDAIQPYRLEMGTAFRTSAAKTLYGYWGTTVSDALAAELGSHADPTLINLASQEYFGVVQPERLPGSVITPVFKEVRGGKAQIISFFAKKARGQMARFIVDQQLDRPESLKNFSVDGYRYEASLSDATSWVFTRQKS
jgi:hypothetical protein